MKTAAQKLASLDRMFRAFADPTRLRILYLLTGGERCGVGDQRSAAEDFAASGVSARGEAGECAAAGAVDVLQAGSGAGRGAQEIAGVFGLLFWRDSGIPEGLCAVVGDVEEARVLLGLSRGQVRLKPADGQWVGWKPPAKAGGKLQPDCG
jgi:DNA-binding transcriptional ArsR family regulator